MRKNSLEAGCQRRIEGTYAFYLSILSVCIHTCHYGGHERSHLCGGQFFPPIMGLPQTIGLHSKRLYPLSSLSCPPRVCYETFEGCQV